MSLKLYVTEIYEYYTNLLCNTHNPECHLQDLLQSRRLKTHQESFWQCYTLESIEYALISLNFMYLKQYNEVKILFALGF